MPSPAIAFHDVSLRWPDDTLAFEHLDLRIPVGRSALVGANGVGKSTLLRLIAGDVAATSGAVQVDGTVAMLRQDLTLRAEVSVAEHLGIADVLTAIATVEAGDVDPATSTRSAPSGTPRSGRSPCSTDWACRTARCSGAPGSSRAARPCSSAWPRCC